MVRPLSDGELAVPSRPLGQNGPLRLVWSGAALLGQLYDPAFCPTEDEWQESRCSDQTCLYCPGRPDRPSQAADLEVVDLSDG